MVLGGGLDSGTYSMDIAGVDDSGPSVFYEEVVPRSRVTENPGIVVELLEELVEKYGVEAIVVSSGYGLPLKPVGEAEDWEIRLATFMHPSDERKGHRILGLRRVMMGVKEAGLPAWFTPGAIHLDSVPVWRKLNRLDIGTSDKVYSAAYVLREEVEDHGVRPSEASFIVVEIGYAYTAALAVEGGRVVDGVGGTSGAAGYMGAGCWDSELAYLVSDLEPGFPREKLFRGGIGDYYFSYPPPPPEEVEERAQSGDQRALEALEALAESAARDVYSLLVSVRPRRVYVTGRWARSGLFMEALREKLWVLRHLGVEVRRPRQLGRRVKEAAVGAALIATGLAGGRYRWIVESLGLGKSRGTILDYIVVEGVGEKAKDVLIGLHGLPR